MAKYRDKIKSKFCFVYTYGKISNSANVKLFFAKGDNQPCQGIKSKTVRKKLLKLGNVTWDSWG